MSCPITSESFEVERFHKLPIIRVPACHFPVKDRRYATVLDDDISRPKVSMSEDNSMLVCIKHATNVRTDVTFRFGHKGISDRNVEVFFATEWTL